MKKILITALIGLFVLGISTTAKAVVIAPGDVGKVTAGAAAPLATSTLVTQRLNIPFTGLDGATPPNTWFKGTLDAKVYSNAATGGTYLFTYQFTLNPGPPNDTIVSVSLTDYSGFNTDVDAAGVAGITLQRLIPTVMYLGGPVSQGQTSPLYWVQTNAKHYKDGTTQLQGSGNCRILTFAPTVPEPSSMLLLGMGILGLFGIGRKRIKA